MTPATKYALKYTGKIAAFVFGGIFAFVLLIWLGMNYPAVAVGVSLGGLLIWVFTMVFFDGLEDYKRRERR